MNAFGVCSLYASAPVRLNPGTAPKVHTLIQFDACTSNLDMFASAPVRLNPDTTKQVHSLIYFITFSSKLDAFHSESLCVTARFDGCVHVGSTQTVQLRRPAELAGDLGQGGLHCEGKRARLHGDGDGIGV